MFKIYTIFNMTSNPILGCQHPACLEQVESEHHRCDSCDTRHGVYRLQWSLCLHDTAPQATADMQKIVSLMERPKNTACLTLRWLVEAGCNARCGHHICSRALDCLLVNKRDLYESIMASGDFEPFDHIRGSLDVIVVSVSPTDPSFHTLGGTAA